MKAAKMKRTRRARRKRSTGIAVFSGMIVIFPRDVWFKFAPPTRE